MFIFNYYLNDENNCCLWKQHFYVGTSVFSFIMNGMNKILIKSGLCRFQKILVCSKLRYLPKLLSFLESSFKTEERGSRHHQVCIRCLSLCPKVGNLKILDVSKKKDKYYVNPGLIRLLLLGNREMLKYG